MVCLANKEMLVNTNCAIPAVMEYIKQQVSSIALQPREFIDLASETGDMVFDLSNKGRDSARRYLEPRQVLLLVKGTYLRDPAATSGGNSANASTDEQFLQQLQQQQQQQFASGHVSSSGAVSAVPIAQYVSLYTDVPDKVKQSLLNPKRKKAIVDHNQQPGLEHKEDRKQNQFLNTQAKMAASGAGAFSGSSSTDTSKQDVGKGSHESTAGRNAAGKSSGANGGKDGSATAKADTKAKSDKQVKIDTAAKPAAAKKK